VVNTSPARTGAAPILLSLLFIAWAYTLRLTHA
jgi:hypothetical protein